MKTTLLAVLFLFTLSLNIQSQMESNIVNRQQEEVVQLYDPDNDELMFIQPGGSLPMSLILSGNTLFIPIKANRIYNIKRIRCIVYLFLSENSEIAYPRWEQFAMNLDFTASLYNAAFQPVGVDLFNHLKTDITDGITSDVIFQEPFIFKTTNTRAAYIALQIDPTGSIFTSISGMTIPPPVGLIGITVKGQVYFEGVSYGINMGAVDEQKNETTAAESGIEVDNAIDIDI